MADPVVSKDALGHGRDHGEGLLFSCCLGPCPVLSVCVVLCLSMCVDDIASWSKSGSDSRFECTFQVHDGVFYYSTDL